MTEMPPAAGSATGPDPADVGPPRGTGRYLYAVCRSLPPSVLDEVDGLEGGMLELVEHRDLLAVVSTVPLASYGEEALRRNLEDLAWLESVVRRHDEVVHAVAAHGPVAPMRLATICFDDDAVRARLRQWAVDLDHVLDRVAGCAEWSVKLLQLAPQAERAEETEAPTSGAEYLRRRKLAAERAAAAMSSAADVAEDVYATLAGLAKASRQLPAQDARLSGLTGTMVLNSAFLVPDGAAGDFAAGLAELRARYPELVLDSRGPWPPYSFAILGQP